MERKRFGRKFSARTGRGSQVRSLSRPPSSPPEPRIARRADLRRVQLLPSSRRRTDQTNAMAFDVRAALFALLGKDLTQIDGLGPYLSLKLIAECGDDL